MGRTRYRFHEDYYPYFITSSILEELPLFSKDRITQVLLDQFVFLQQHRKISLYGYVIMPNNFHAIVKGKDIAKKLRLAKSYTARQILKVLKSEGHTRWLDKFKRNKRSYKIGRTFQVWQEGLHPKQLSTDEMVFQKIEYIHNNPVKSGFVDEPTHWKSSSARNYLGKEGIIPVTLFGG